MGQRYQRILARLGSEYLAQDKEFVMSEKYPRVTHVIIATPTATHFELVRHFLTLGIHVLCEKPVVMSAAQALELREHHYSHLLRWVCNWRFVTNVPLEPESNKIVYKTPHSGDDGLEWDCVQLVYLAHNFSLVASNIEPAWSCTINGKEISLLDIDLSYMTMIHRWMCSPNTLWDVEDLVNATCKTEAFIKYRMEPK